MRWAGWASWASWVRCACAPAPRRLCLSRVAHPRSPRLLEISSCAGCHGEIFPVLSKNCADVHGLPAQDQHRELIEGEPLEFRLERRPSAADQPLGFFEALAR